MRKGLHSEKADRRQSKNEECFSTAAASELRPWLGFEGLKGEKPVHGPCRFRAHMFKP